MTIQIDGKISKETVDFDEALAAAGTGKFQLKIVLIGALTLMCSYIAVSATSFLLPTAQCDLKMSSTDKGHLMSAGFLGIAVSCHFWGFLSDTLGRRYVLTRCLFADGLLYIITSLTPNYILILIWKFCNGFASSGGIVSLYAYIGEFHSDKSRLKALMIMSVLASSTYFLLPVLAWMILPGKWSLTFYPGLIFKPWRLYYACNGIPSLLCSFLIYFLPESPKFLLAKGEKTKALEVLQRIHNENSKKDNKTDYLIKNIVLNEYGEITKTNTKINNSNKVTVFFILMWNQTIPLFKASHRMSIVLLCLIQYLIYLSNGGIFLWLPETSNRIADFKNEWGDKSATYCDIMQYRKEEMKYNSIDQNLFALSTSSIARNNSKKLFLDNSLQQSICKSDIDITVYLHLGILGIGSSLTLGLIVILTSFFDKKHIIEFFLLVSLLCSICLLVVKMMQIIPIVISIIIILSGTCIPIINSMAVDLFPTNLRSMASCFALMSSRLGTVTANALSGSLIDCCCSVLVWCFIISFAVSTVFISLLPKKPLCIKEMKKIAEEI